MEKLNVVYFGYSDAMVENVVASELFKLVHVVSVKGKSSQRETELVAENHIPYTELERKQDLLELKFEDGVDAIIMYKFEYIIPQSIIDNHRIINFHGGDLRYNRGGHAPVWSILNLDKRTCLSMYQLTGGIDEGLLIDTHEVEIDELDNTVDLNRKLSAGIPCLLVSLYEYLNGKREAHLVTGGRYLPKIKETDFTIDITNDSIDQISAKIRSQQTYFGALIFINDVRCRCKSFTINKGCFLPTRQVENNKLIVREVNREIVCELAEE